MNFDIYTLVLRLIIALIALPIHECAPGYAAYRMGDHTAYRQGRLTLNPLAHLDPMGTFAIILFGFGWAKPVPVNPYYYKNRKLGMAVTAAAGPLSNFLLAYFFLVAYKVCAWTSLAGQGGAFLENVCIVLYMVVKSFRKQH